MMEIKQCRVCGSDFFAEPLLAYQNMPAVAQFFPDEAGLKNDQGVSLNVCQCSGCGLVQLDNAPVHYYKDVIRAAAFSAEMRGFRVKQFVGFINKYKLSGKKIIEIGCGQGEYLSLMKEAGVEAYGLEHLETSVQSCLKRGLNVVQGFVDKVDYTIAGQPFAAFYILNFLEHLPNPNVSLRGIYNNLAEGGLGLVEVPNFDMMLKKKMFSEFTSDHLLYFTKETLTTALENNGFEVLECFELWHEYIISAVVQKKPAMPDRIVIKKRADQLDLSAFHADQAKLMESLNKFINSFGNKQVSIWGAGHQALAVMALADLSGKIKYVVDSATFKQNKFTPATHIPIVSPERLKSDPVEAIIVMAASYSEEVVKTIKDKFDQNIKIAVLRDFGLEAIN